MSDHKSEQKSKTTTERKVSGARKSATAVLGSDGKVSDGKVSRGEVDAPTRGTTKSGATATVTKRARGGVSRSPVEAPAPVRAAARVAVELVAAGATRTVKRASASEAAAVRATKAPVVLPLSERPIDQVWREYRANPTTEVRNFLIARHLELVAYAAERLHKRLPSEVEINDLKSAGAFGLMDAVDSFDPERGVKFETYCTQRIRGAMFDELRSMDWVPRLVRSRTAKVDKVRKSIEMETGRRATEDEVATRLNVSGDEFEKLQKDSRPISMVSLTRKCFETDSSKDVREIDVVEDGRQENPLQAVQKQDLQALITKGLSRAERLIVILYYYEEMTMKEIGATLDLSESRVSQMHSSILQRLKAQMQHRESDEE
ncbi:MAG: polymerase sigma factor FliA [Planctomycetota bacterium]